MEDKKMTTEESLELITRMIRTTRGNVKGGSIYFMLWGWVVVIGSVGQFLLHTQVDYKHPYIIWVLTIPVAIYTFWHAAKKGKNRSVKTYSDGILWKTWLGFIGCMLVVIVSGKFLNHHVTALIMMFTGFATYVSGLIIRFRPLYLGAILFWALTPLALYVGVVYSPLIMTVAIVFGYLVPGYILKYKK